VIGASDIFVFLSVLGLLLLVSLLWSVSGSEVRYVVGTIGVTGVRPAAPVIQACSEGHGFHCRCKRGTDN